MGSSVPPVEMDGVPPGPGIPAPALWGGRGHPIQGNIPCREQVKRLRREAGVASLLLIHHPCAISWPCSGII